MSKPAARIGDMHVCPMVTPGLPPIPHVGGPILGPGCPTVLIGGVPAAVMGDSCLCVGPPDSIVLGSTGVLIGNKPAARMGDMCVHGGSIVVGCPTVLIGEMSPGSPPPPPVIKMLMLASASASSDHSQKTAQVIALKRAAESGTPFCEKCEAARNASKPPPVDPVRETCTARGIKVTLELSEEEEKVVLGSAGNQPMFRRVLVGKQPSTATVDVDMAKPACAIHGPKQVLVRAFGESDRHANGAKVRLEAPSPPSSFWPWLSPFATARDLPFERYEFQPLSCARAEAIPSLVVAAYPHVKMAWKGTFLQINATFDRSRRGDPGYDGELTFKVDLTSELTYGDLSADFKAPFTRELSRKTDYLKDLIDRILKPVLLRLARIAEMEGAIDLAFKLAWERETAVSAKTGEVEFEGQFVIIAEGGLTIARKNYVRQALVAFSAHPVIRGVVAFARWCGLDPADIIKVELGFEFRLEGRLECRDQGTSQGTIAAKPKGEFKLGVEFKRRFQFALLSGSTNFEVNMEASSTASISGEVMLGLRLNGSGSKPSGLFLKAGFDGVEVKVVAYCRGGAEMSADEEPETPASPETRPAESNKELMEQSVGKSFMVVPAVESEEHDLVNW